MAENPIAVPIRAEHELHSSIKLIVRGKCPQRTFHVLFNAIEKRSVVARDEREPAEHVADIQDELKALFLRYHDTVSCQKFISSRMFRLIVTSAYNADHGRLHPDTRHVLGGLYYEDEYDPNFVDRIPNDELKPNKPANTYPDDGEKGRYAISKLSEHFSGISLGKNEVFQELVAYRKEKFKAKYIAAELEISGAALSEFERSKQPKMESVVNYGRAMGIHVQFEASLTPLD